MSSPTPITIIQGAQFGSEAKGMVAGALALNGQYNIAVRTGAINAGHTVYYKGKPYAMQQLPVAWVNPDTKLVIGPGAYVHVPTLVREIAMVEIATGKLLKDRLFVDSRCSIHLDSYADESKAADRHHKIGATGKGCAEAIVHKIKDRGDANLLLIDNVLPGAPWTWVNASDFLADAYHSGSKIMLEGTQGELLDFHLGPWPYVTSRQTTAAAWVAEAGLSPVFQYEILLVARTYPIRVAGNSGPLPKETTWPILARTIRYRLMYLGFSSDHLLWVDEECLKEFEDKVIQLDGWNLLNHHMQPQEWRDENKVLLSEYAGDVFANMHKDSVANLLKLFEVTTVTKKLRRVAYMNELEVLGLASRMDAKIVLTFLNYKCPEFHNSTTAPRYFPRAYAAVTTGPQHMHFHWL